MTDENVLLVAAGFASCCGAKSTARPAATRSRSWRPSTPTGMLTGARAVARGTCRLRAGAARAARRGEMLLHNHPSGRLEPSMADLSIAARAHDGGIGFGIVDNSGERLYVVVEVPAPTPVTRLDPFDVIALLGEHGPVSRELGSYEDRQSQRDLSAHLVDAYNDGGVLLLEAGTGVGKSFAYLVPALAGRAPTASGPWCRPTPSTCRSSWSARTCRCCGARLSDDTYEPTFALLKGWRNYLCRLRLETATASQQSLLEGDKHDELVNIAAGRRTRRRHTGRPAGSAIERSLGRSRRRSRPLPAPALPALRPLFRLPGPAQGGAGRCRRRQSPPARRRSRRPTGVGQLGGSGGPAAVPAPHSR